MLCVFLNPEFELNGLSGFLRELTIAYNYVLEAMCRWSKGCAGASDENGWSSHREERYFDF